MRTKEQNAARMRATRAAADPVAMAVKRAAQPSRVNRTVEYRSRYGEEWEPLDSRPFVGIDGEGGEWNGGHSFGCLTVGDVTLINGDGSPLSSLQCLVFLTSRPKFARYVGYFLGYDWTMMFRDLSVKDQARILEGRFDTEGRRQLVWVADGLYGVDYIPKKICKLVRSKSHPDGAGAITVFDVSSYWQCAFTRALEDWDVGSPKERETIAETKEKRQHFSLPVPPYVVAYNLLETRLLGLLVQKMVDTTAELGLHIRSYHGPATLAQALFEQHNVLQYSDV